MTQSIQNSLIKVQKKIYKELLNNNKFRKIEEYVKKEYIEPILSILGWNKLCKFQNPLESNYRKGNYVLKEFQFKNTNG